jgi:Tol biopolymer transport system component
MRIEKWSEAGRNLVLGSVVLLGISCGGEDAVAPTTGSVEITTTTSGPDPDVDGYTISIDGGAEVAVGTDATLRRDDLGAGEHSVRLNGMAGNCTVEGGNPRTIAVTAGQPTSVTFVVSCTALPPTTGTLTITTITTGSSLDPDGYTASVDGGSEQFIGANATLTISDLAAGSHTVALTGLANNCAVVGTNSRDLTLAAGGNITIAFLVDCAALDSKIAFWTHRDGNGEIYLMNSDGSHLVNLTNSDQIDESGPTWSPDGSKIAFTIGNDFYVINADGTGRKKLPISLPGSLPGSFYVLLEWSPDWSKLLFLSNRDHIGEEGDDPVFDIYVMNADGTGQARLTYTGDGTESATWSPDGSKIAFESSRDGNREIYVMNADGSGQENLTRSAELVQDREPRWSPDGTMIAFERHPLDPACCPGRIWVMNADGTGQIPLTEPGIYWDIRWSPDGHRIAFMREPADRSDFDLWVMNSDGSGMLNLTHSPMTEAAADWSPDGSRLVFVASGEDDPWAAESEIFVINADGSGRTNLSNSPGPDHGPDWAPR